MQYNKWDKDGSICVQDLLLEVHPEVEPELELEPELENLNARQSVTWEAKR